MRIKILGNGPSATTLVLSAYRKADVSLASPFEPKSVCAGGIGYWALKDIERVVDRAVVEYIYRSVKTYVDFIEFFFHVTPSEFNTYSVSKGDLKLPFLGIVIDRVEFDRNLLNKALNYVTDVKSFDMVVDARGYVSQVHIPKKDLFVAGQYWIETKDVDNGIRIRFWKIPKGYFWEFPEEDNGILKLGVAVSLEDIEVFGHPKKLLDEYIDVFKINGRIVKQGYKLLPLTKPSKSVLVGKEIRVGTAGLLVDPLTGAGIKYALISSSILSKCLGNSNIEKCYTKKLGSTLRKLQVHYVMREWAERKGIWGYEKYINKVRKMVEFGVWRAFVWLI